MNRAFIIYGATSGIVRRVVTTDSTDFRISNHLGLGETHVEVPNFDPQVGVDVDQVMIATKGITPPSPRCAIIQNGNVVGVVNADPNIDTLPGAQLILHPDADIGWKHNGGFTPPPDPHPRGNGTATPPGGFEVVR